MAASKPQFTVWTRNLNDDDSWVEALVTDDLDAAHDHALELGVGNVASTIWERGRYQVNGRQHTETIAFWWTDNLNETWGAPEGRGSGWPETGDELVDYEPVGRQAVAPTGSRAVVAEAVRRYKTVACEKCGLELPQNEAHHYIEEVKVGSISGTRRSGYSSTNRTSSRSFSSSSTHRESYTSGRSIYKNRPVWLCSEHYAAQLQADKSVIRVIGKILRWLS